MRFNCCTTVVWEVVGHMAVKDVKEKSKIYEIIKTSREHLKLVRLVGYAQSMEGRICETGEF